MAEYGVDRSTTASGSSTSGTVAGFVRLLENQVGPDYITLLAPVLAANWTLTFPADDGTANQFLQTDGAGATSWVSLSTGDLATQYALLLGRAGSQIIRGGTAASETLTLRGTSHATTGLVALNDLGGDVTVGGGTTASELRILEASGSGTNYTAFKAQAQAANVTYTLPADDGDANDFLQSNGSGTLDWVVPDHGAHLGGLGDDDHTQYALLLGRSGGQIIRGGTAASETLTLRGTSHATVGALALNDLGGDVIIGGGTTASNLRLLEASGSGTNYTEFRTQAQAANVTYILPANDGDADQLMTTDGSGTLSWTTPAGGGTFSVTQASHGFVVGDVLYLTGGTYAKADSDAVATSEVVGIVDSSADANTFVLRTVGRITGLSGLTAGTVYFLSGTAGALTATEPTTVGAVSKPLLIAHTTSGGYFFNFRGSVVGSATSTFAVDLFSGDGSDVTFDLSATPAHENNTLIFISGVYQQKNTYSVSGVTVTFSTAPPTGTSNIQVITVGSLGVGTVDIAGNTEDTAPNPAADYVLTYDASAAANKKVLLGVARRPTLGTEQASTSGTAIDFTGIPDGTTLIIINLVGVSTNGTSSLAVQLGDAGGIETTGYLGRGQPHNDTVSFVAATSSMAFHGGTAGATDVNIGQVILCLEDSTEFTWVVWGIVTENQTIGASSMTYRKSLSAVLDRVRITSVNADTFDAGAINIAYF